MLTKSHTEQAKMETIPEHGHGQECEDKKHLDMLTKSHMFLSNCNTKSFVIRRSSNIHTNHVSCLYCLIVALFTL